MESTEIGIYIDRTYKVVRQDLINRFQRHNIDITPEQWILLSKLQQKSATQSDLAEDSFKDKPTVSRILDLLEARNLVVRKPDQADKRRLRVALTQEGQKIVEKARPQVMASRNIAWSNISEQEYVQMISVLNKIYAAYSEGK